jgi:peptidoglycan/LPS O-acetylase OafA/YrhL
MNYRREVDGLRALAVLPVILFHAGFETFSGGFVGVDVFFVISGYLITTIILDDLQSGTFSVVNFYERRARRILPALFFVMLVCIPFAWLWLLPVLMKDFSQSLVAVSVFASNIWFWRESGYFDTAAELKPLLHTWSLAVEEQFYVFFPLFLMLIWRLGRRWVVIVLAPVFAISLALAQWASIAEPTAAFYLLPTRGWELLIGAFAAIYLSRASRPQFGKGMTEALGGLGVLMIFASVFAYSAATPFPGLYALLPTVGTVLIILFASQQTAVGQFVGNAVFVGIGLISYSAYLWHQPLFAFLKHSGYGESTTVYLVLIAVTFGLAYLTWRFIENPFRRKQTFGRATIFLLAALMMAFFIGFGALGHKTHGFSDRSHMLKFADLAYDASKLGYSSCNNALTQTEPKLNYCYGEGEPADALVIGDSHADDKLYGIAEAVKDFDWMLVGNTSCPPLMGLRFKSADNTECNEILSRLFAYLDKQDALKVAVLSFSQAYPLEEYIAADDVQLRLDPEDTIAEDIADPALNKVDAFYAGLDRTVEFLVSRNVATVIILDIPELTYFPADCIKGKVECSFSKAAVLERQKILRAKVAELQRSTPNVHVFDSLDVFCVDGSDTCSILKDGRILYRDSHHLGHYGSLVFGAVFAAWFKSNVR